MDHWERMRAALRGEEVDRPPICLWRHWPVEDHETAQRLATAMTRWQREYDCDLVKHAPAGTYVIEDWGGRTEYVPEESPALGTRAITRRAVTDTSRWPALEPLDVTRGHLGMQLEAMRLMADALGGSVPILQTIFSPLNIAPKLGGELAFSDLRQSPAVFRQGLAIIAGTMARFASASIRAGADGILFVAPCDRELYSKAEYREFGVPWDRLILETVRPDAEIIIVLLLGREVMFDLVADYPVDGLNWPDRRDGPSLREAQERFSGLVMGGIDERQTLLHGPEEAIRTEIEDAVAQCEGRGLLVGPGSTPFTDTPAAHFRAARAAVETGAPG
jgi:uroporphyrinogen decarboxylase